MSILVLKNLSLKKRGKQIIKNVSLSLSSGKIYALVGQNGAGKSSLAYTLMGLDGYRDVSGDIFWQGESIKELNVQERAQLGLTLAWQEPARFHGLKIKDYLQVNGTSLKKIKEALQLVGFDSKDYLNRVVDGSLSGGERKRIELASIICFQPKLVILDEPDSGIDIEAMDKVFDVFQYLKNKGTAILVITHSMQVLKHVDEAFLFWQGHLVSQGDKYEALNYFQNKCLNCQHRCF